MTNLPAVSYEGLREGQLQKRFHSLNFRLGPIHYFKPERAKLLRSEANFLVAAGVVKGFMVEPAGAIAENTALVISMTESHSTTNAAAHPKKVLQQPTCPEWSRNGSDISRVSDFTLCFEGLNT